MAVYNHEVSLAAFISIIGYLEPEKHVRIVMYDKNYDLHNREEFTDIPLTVYNLARYSEYPVHDVVEENGDISLMIDYDK